MSSTLPSVAKAPIWFVIKVSIIFSSWSLECLLQCPEHSAFPRVPSSKTDRRELGRGLQGTWLIHVLLLQDTSPIYWHRVPYLCTILPSSEEGIPDLLSLNTWRNVPGDKTSRSWLPSFSLKLHICNSSCQWKSKLVLSCCFIALKYFYGFISNSLTNSRGLSSPPVTQHAWVFANSGMATSLSSDFQIMF